MKDGVKISHKSQDGTEEFLVNMIVHRCKLCFEAGAVDEVIAILQAITEFHFFAPYSDVKKMSRVPLSRVMYEPFRTFWELGVPRIGDDNALGFYFCLIKKNFFFKFRMEEQRLHVGRNNRRS